MPPAQRFKVLEEEKKKQFEMKTELERTETLSLRAGSERYWLMFCLVGFVVVITAFVQRNLGKDPGKSLSEEMYNKSDIFLPSGAHISLASLTDFQAQKSFWENPERPDNYWVNPEKLAKAGVGVPDKNISQVQEQRKRRESLEY